ncbi:MAG: glutamine--tRNA ligase/YqeY domain fusion protein [Eubacteriales bacterium]|nr:glutamine--tRNA ligase/YqeY domain fusion protein [Eubacteriales bacterium]MDD3536952.1 glutamine--tRNA ligase/YqeY domain fusion protein [Eubacteriales bacterium]MDD4285588.1 glutamine--tRNA ligase/YqeY domain fusion protein [Eubacteriales bacterium]NLV70682.1 glutamine--tRNA ligase/YqeY domain fusion protein [Clostridiales bacterium]HPF18574.1 glutamine--tRNA ligase/YqeY domain fusion protein [Bacillota bacterium]
MADDVKRAGNESAPAKESGTNFIHAIIEKDLEQQKYSRQIMTRFPPEPNGYLHIGHAKSICLNFGTALKYGGGCNLRYDDTNPVTEDEEFVGSIEEDVKWLGFQWDNLLYASDYFETMFEGAVKLIKAGKAYVCELTADEIRSTRGTLTEPGTNSPYRDRPIEESLQMFMDMRAGKYEDGSVVLRAKIDMASPNINMRDPVIFRVLHATHHNTGDAWCIYPMYDYAHPIEDAVEGITHSICTLEFEDHRPFYDWVLENLEWPEPPQQIEFAKLNLSNTIMSKRNIKRLVGEGEVEGWDDPRLCTIAGIRRRGYTPEAIRAFCDAVGVAKANSQVEMSMLEYFVRDDLKERVESRMVILDPVKVVLTNYPEDQQEMLPVENNMSVPEMGLREVPFSRVLYIEREDFMEIPPKKYFRLYPGNEVRLKGAYFITCTDVVKDAEGNITEILCTYDPATKSGSGFDERKPKGTIHWVDAKSAVDIPVRQYGYLSYPDEETGKQVFDPESRQDVTAKAEPSIRKAAPGERFQFFRNGYYIADTVLSKEGAPVFNQIVGLKSSWKKG